MQVRNLRSLHYNLGGSLAYKIYKKAKGKRHGPYFYKNVRTAGGVKTIYLGKDNAFTASGAGAGVFGE